MLMEEMVEAMMAEIKQKVFDFSETRDLETLTPELAEGMTQAVKEGLALGGAGLRTFLLSFDTHQDLVRNDEGELFRFKATRGRAFMTPFGKMLLERRCYQNKSDTKGFAPLDASWGMEGHYMTPEVREAVLFSCAHVTPVETAQLLKKNALFNPDPTTIKREVEKTGALVCKHRDAIDEAVRSEEPVPDETKALVVSADGATVLMNEKGVHFGRPSQRLGPDAPKEKPTAYRVAMVGSVSHYGAPKAPGETPQRLRTRYVGHMPEKHCPTFKNRLEKELDQVEKTLPEETPRILLLDGARELWAYFDNNERYDNYNRCIDFWHAVEHLSVACEALFGSGEKAKNWYEKHRRILKESDDGARRILRSIDYYASKYKRSKTSARRLQEQRTYFKRNGKLMRYATFRERGWPIGSGPIEAACKTLVKTRLCRSGMRWTRPGGQNILDLRIYVKSNRWDSAWKQIKQLKNTG